MSQHDNIAATLLLGKLIKSENLNAFYKVFAPTVVDRGPASDPGLGAEAL